MNGRIFLHMEHCDDPLDVQCVDNQDPLVELSLGDNLGQLDVTVFLTPAQAEALSTKLSAATGSDLAERCEELESACRTVRYELAALVEDPNNPDWMPALGNENPADASCLSKAFSAATDAIATAKTATQ